jgi:hypothetical protein
VTDIDAFFTQSIVGTPFSIALGQRLSSAQARELGLEVPLDSRAARLGRAWQDAALLRGAEFAQGPRPRPGAVRRWLERHALVLAGLGLGSLIAAGTWALWLGTMAR